MSSHRTQRLAEAIREVVATAVLFEVADPRVRAVTVLGAEVSGDLRNATVHVSVMGTQADQKTAMQGLKSATGFLQSRVAARLQTRFTPVLSFKLDESVKKSVEISKLIDDALAEDRRGPGQADAENSLDDDEPDEADDHDVDDEAEDEDVDEDDDVDDGDEDQGRATS
ncbi:MAG: 30S ribosome-binding factor RbfA [Isosphaeraceae bacterium]